MSPGADRWNDRLVFSHVIFERPERINLTTRTEPP
jgi:hypothetical protein